MAKKTKRTRITITPELYEKIKMLRTAGVSYSVIKKVTSASEATIARINQSDSFEHYLQTRKEENNKYRSKVQHAENEAILKEVFAIDDNPLLVPDFDAPETVRVQPEKTLQDDVQELTNAVKRIADALEKIANSKKKGWL